MQGICGVWPSTGRSLGFFRVMKVVSDVAWTGMGAEGRDADRRAAVRRRRIVDSRGGHRIWGFIAAFLAGGLEH